jgi:predicted transcriptional regulator
MASDEIMQYIPPATLEKIQASDEHPLYRAYIIGEEGNATPRIVGEGSRVLNWMRSAISAMVSKLQFGTKIFFNHGETNEHQGRTVVGELVGKALEYVKGKMQAIAIAYIYPDQRDKPADAASIEAEI